MAMSLDEFLGHKTSTRDDGGRVLNWKKRKPARLNAWLHTQAPFVALWRHGFPRIVEIERDGEKMREVWGGTFNCHETEEVLRKQYRRTQNGERILPPERCPICKLNEYLRTEVREGRLNWLTPVFEFVADDPEQTVVLTAAGIFNGFNGDLSRAEVAEMRRAGVSQKDAWKQNCMAKCSYVFTIVDADEPGDGVQVCVETTALGDAVKAVVRNQMDALGETEGNPLKTPYAIRWEYLPDEQEFGKKYRALPLPKLEMTPEVRALIVDSPPADIGKLIARGDALALRAVMETAAKIELPFDRIFGEGSQVAARPARAVQVPREEAEEPKAPAPAPARRRATTPVREPVAPKYPPGTVLIPCDSCGAQMADTDAQCWKCGATYELVEAKPMVAETAPKGKPAAKVEPPPDSEDDDGLPW